MTLTSFHSSSERPIDMRFFFFFFIAFLIHSAQSVPTIAIKDDAKLTNGRPSYRAFSLFDLPVVGNRPVSANLDVSDDYSPTDVFVLKNPPAEQNQPNEEYKPIGVVPKFTGSFLTPPAAIPTSGSDGSAVANPASYFLEGADLSKISKPKCQMIGCDGPVANDGDFMMNYEKGEPGCYNTFVPLNGCIDNKGYSVGMVCKICCECTTSFINEMSKSRGFKENYSPFSEQPLSS